MAITFNLGFNPFWTVFDLVGRPAGGANMFTYHSLDPTVKFPVYMDPGGNEAWTNPILFDENGQQGPFYFQFDSDTPDDTYFIEIFDTQGNLIWQIDDYSPVTGSGGGSVITTNLSVSNTLGNSVFWRNNGNVTNPASGTILCPGNHASMSMSDITYVRTGGTLTDSVSFIKFSPAGDTPLNDDITPEYYLEYSSLTNASGETVKGIQYALVSHLKTLEKAPMAYSFWAKGNSGAQTLTLQILQYTGTGGSPDNNIYTTINIIPLTGSWKRYSGTFNVPSSAGLTLGTNGDDALYMHMGFPLSQACNIDYTKFELFAGSVAPTLDFDTYDQIDSIVNTPRTGDLRTSINSFAPFGWVPMNDGTIGNPSSGATTRANLDTFYLYSLIWNQTNTSAATQLYAPIFAANSYTPTTRGASASADFAANRKLSLTRALGRALSGAVPTNDSKTFTFVTTTLTLAGASPTTFNFNTGTPIYFTTSGTLPSPLNLNTTYYAIQLSATTIGVANTPEDAVLGNALSLSGGSGTQTVNVQDYPVGTFFGTENKALVKANLPSHLHAPLAGNGFLGPTAAGPSFNITGPATNVLQRATTGDIVGGTNPPTPVGLYQPTAFYNVFVKL